MQILVSIICPMYNAEKYIANMIKSVLRQTYQHWELIIIDDGSTDQCANICRRYMDEDSRIRLISRENGGVSVARNIGIENARGEYIAFVDADDEYSPELLERMLEKTGNEIDLVYANYLNMNRQELTISREKIIEGTLGRDEFVDYVLLHSAFTTVWRGLFRASLCKKCEFSSLKFCEDLFYILEYARCVRKVKLVKEAYYHYRRDNINSMTNNEKSKQYLVDYAKIPILLCEYFIQNQYEEQKYAEIVAEFYCIAEERIIKAANYKEYKDLIHLPKYIQGQQWYLNILKTNGVDMPKKSVVETNTTLKYYYMKSKCMIRAVVHRSKKFIKM